MQILHPQATSVLNTVQKNFAVIYATQNVKISIKLEECLTKSEQMENFCQNLKETPYLMEEVPLLDAEGDNLLASHVYLDYLVQAYKNNEIDQFFKNKMVTAGSKDLPNLHAFDSTFKFFRGDADPQGSQFGSSYFYEPDLVLASSKKEANLICGTQHYDSHLIEPLTLIDFDLILFFYREELELSNVNWSDLSPINTDSRGNKLNSLGVYGLNKKYKILQVILDNMDVSLEERDHILCEISEFLVTNLPFLVKFRNYGLNTGLILTSQYHHNLIRRKIDTSDKSNGENFSQNRIELVKFTQKNFKIQSIQINLYQNFPTKFELFCDDINLRQQYLNTQVFEIFDESNVDSDQFYEIQVGIACQQVDLIVIKDYWVRGYIL